MTAKKKPETNAGAELGFAAFLDLRDSTYVWNQNPDLAEEALGALARTVESTTKEWHGRIGNFTGDGFLVLFPTADHAIRGLAEVIEAWEPQRRALCKSLARRGTQPPDECSLMVRSGIAYGRYHVMRVLTGADVAGEAINRASRCTGAAKPYFTTASVATALGLQQRIFVTQDAFNLVADKGGYWHSTKLPVEFNGYERPTSGGLVTTPDHIVAVWPKGSASASDAARTPEESLQRAASAASSVEVADRLVAAVAAATRAQAPIGKPSKDALLAAVASYRDALARLPDHDLQSQRAQIHGRLGFAHAALADMLAPPERRTRLDEALQAFKDSLALIDSDDDPEESGAVNSNIAGIRRRQSELVPPAERAHYLTEAVRALRNVLQTGRYIADPNRHSIALGSLALVLGSQADYLNEDAKEGKWTEVGDVLRQALAVTTPANNPHHYASVQSDLSNALRMEARQIDARSDRDALLASGESMAREAVRALDAVDAPSRYANAQVNLGLVLLDRAQLTRNTEAMLMLSEAADSFKEALKVNDSKEYWLKRANILENLALALQLQAGLLGGADRTRQITEARRASEQALKIYKETGHAESADRVAKAIRKMPGATEPA